MKKPLATLLLLNIIIGIALIVIFYFAILLSGSSSMKYLHYQKQLLLKFAILHFAANFLMLYKVKQINSASIAASIVIICLVYFFAAWRFEYLTII
jgi:hypothetical protein